MRQVLIALFLGAALNASAFSLIGPFEPWQTPALGYNWSGTDRGAPKNLGDEYRWNIPAIAYGFDRAFLDFFGEEGAAAVDEAIEVLNALPPASELDPAHFGQDTRRVNMRAQAEELLDLKTVALSLLLEQLGLARPERWAWTLRDRAVSPSFTNYFVVQRNFDPLAWSPSAFVNGTRYTYQVIESDAPLFADALEIPIDLAASDNTVAGLHAAPRPGLFVQALTSDDAGGLRYMLHPSNLNFEPAVAGSIRADASASATLPDALRPGRDKLLFMRAPSEWSVTSGWKFTNSFVDIRYDGVDRVEAPVRRVISRPDIVFSAAELEPDRLWSIEGPRFAKAAELQDRPGPGIMQPGVSIAFAKLSGGLINRFPGATTEAAAVVRLPRWASFDVSARLIPWIYPAAAREVRLNASILQIGADRQIQISFEGAPGASYELQRSTDLVQWIGGTILSNASGKHEITMPLAEPARFFRATKLPSSAL